MSKQNALDSKWNSSQMKVFLKQGEKIDYSVGPVKSVKSGWLLVAPGELTGLLSFSSFPENGTVLQKGSLESGRKLGSWKLSLQ